jgi:hypothetical protein
MTDLGPAPPGYRWVWSDYTRAWVLAEDPAHPARSPPARSDIGPFDMPVRRNKPLSADRPAVVAVGEAVRRMR